MDNNTRAFFALLRAGLWEQEVRLSSYEPIDFNEVYRLAEEQSVVGIVAAGLEHVVDVKVPKMDVLQFAGQALVLEQRNAAMNKFIGDLVDKMRAAGIYTVLVKGQGIAQCYERPLWRACGDVDLLLDEENYEKAKSFLIPIADSVERESGKHIGITIGEWIVELHGNQHCGLSYSMDKTIDKVQTESFCNEGVRAWMNGGIQVFLPSPNNDIIFIFTHFLKHFYKGGLGMRQVCDWCRLLWTFRDEIDENLLKNRLKKMRLVSEWKAFGTYAVDFLAMSPDAMPLYEKKSKWSRKARRINSFVMEVGNMGHNRDMGCNERKSFFGRKVRSFSRRVTDFFNHALIFPLDSLRFFPTVIFYGIKSAAQGIG